MKTPEARQQGHTREQGRVQEAWLPEEPSGIIVKKTNIAKQKKTKKFVVAISMIAIIKKSVEKKTAPRYLMAQEKEA